MNSVLLLVIVTLAIIALVLVVVAAKLVKGATKPPAAAPSPPTFTPVTATTTPSSPTPQPPKSVPVQSRRDGETESFDISAKNHHVLWCCPCCGTENSSGTRCMVCAQSRSS